MLLSIARRHTTIARRHTSNFFNDNVNNIKNTWKGIKQIINIKNKNNKQPTSLLINDELITEPKQVAKNFNK